MFKNLTIKMQLIALIGFMSVLLIGLGAAGLLGIRESNEGLRTVYENRTVPMSQLGEIRYLIASNRLAVESTLITSTEEYTKEQAD
jgi:CHASE3 domain sensor protein